MIMAISFSGISKPMKTDGDGICHDCGRNVMGALIDKKLTKCEHCGGRIETRETITSLENGYAFSEREPVPADSERRPR